MTKPSAERFQAILEILKESTKGMQRPMSRLIVEKYGQDPFLVLVSCLLSLRSRDSMTYEVSQRLFEQAKTPRELLALASRDLEAIIKKIGFYRKKAATLQMVSRMLIERFDGKVPATEEELLSLPGVGPKTANLVLSVGFNKPAICVDVHVHRVCNRLGLLTTKTPEQTEAALKVLVPRQQWSQINDLFVMWGQNICTPLSPRCSICPLSPLCPKRGVTRSR